MKCDDEVRAIMLNILGTGLLRIRALANEGHSEACSIEADHLHNIPSLIQQFDWDRLLFYWQIEKQRFVCVTPCDYAQFMTLWQSLEVLLRQNGKLMDN